MTRERVNLTGLEIGKLTAIRFHHAHPKTGASWWLCECECSKQIVRPAYHLQNGTPTSCGCSRKSVNTKNIVGKRFGHLTVVERAATSKDHHATWRCVCDCGNEKNVISNSLVSGNVKTCGCRMR